VSARGGGGDEDGEVEAHADADVRELVGGAEDFKRLRGLCGEGGGGGGVPLRM
jgi:hypothetical protein